MNLKRYYWLQTFIVLTLLFFSSSFATAKTNFLGPLKYFSREDSHLYWMPLSYFYLEDFEDGLLNTPGVIASAGDVTSNYGYSGSIIDSVDGDDGDPNNGSCLGCNSFFYEKGKEGITFLFNKKELGSLPTWVGIVWTDGKGEILFEAFDPEGKHLGTVSGNHADGGVHGTTREDKFYAVFHSAGISAIRISNSLLGIEVDHLQYGKGNSTPPPAKLAKPQSVQYNPGSGTKKDTSFKSSFFSL